MKVPGKLMELKNSVVNKVKGTLHDMAAETIASVENDVTTVLKNSSGDILGDVVPPLLGVGAVLLSIWQGSVIADQTNPSSDIRKDYGDYYEVHTTYNVTNNYYDRKEDE